MKQRSIGLLVLLLLAGKWITWGQSATDLTSRISKQSQLMSESKTADDIYTVKTRIDKMAEETVTSSSQAAKIRDAYLLMSDKLAEYSHYKSGCLVYFSYLSWEDRYHQLLLQEVRDSLGAGPQSAPTTEPVQEEVETSVVPNDTVVKETGSDVEETNVAENPIQDPQSDYTTWLVVMAVLVVFFGLLFLRQRKTVSLLKNDLENEQKEVRRLFRISSGVSMLSGVIRYAKEFSLHCADVLSDLVDMSRDENMDVDFSKPKEAIDVFKRISQRDLKKS